MPQTSPISLDERLSAIALPQCGVISRAQLSETGLDSRAVARRVRRGLLRPVYPRVLSLGDISVNRGASQLSRASGTVPALAPAWAAVLQAGHGVVVSAHWALHAHGLCASPRHEVQVVSARVIQPPPGFGHRRLPWLGKHDVTTVGGLPVASVGVALATMVHLEAADAQSIIGLEHEVTALLSEAAYRGLLRCGVLERDARQMTRLRGRRYLLKGLANYHQGRAGFRSQSERRLYRAIIGDGLPAPDVGVPVPTRVGSIEVDFIWWAAGVVVEVDGPGHERPPVARSDRQRDVALGGVGLRVVRIPTWVVWDRPQRAVSTVRRALGR